MPDQPARSLSIYRGYADAGCGEGPGQPIARGEQYLAVDEPLAGDAETLASIRPWLTLDADPADHRTLGAELEAWSCFEHGAYVYVARLTCAPSYQGRIAYFTHARAWPASQVRGGFDPGAHLGRSELFEAPWREPGTGVRVPEADPGMVRPGQVAAEPDAAARLLAHCFEAARSRWSLIIGVPEREFRAGHPLHSLVSFARAALPLRLKRRCAFRIYSHHPDTFLLRRDCCVVVVPERRAADALAAKPEATLLDREGRAHGTGTREPPTEARRFADAVVERATALPAGLLGFSARLDDRFGAEPPVEPDSVAITYNLAFAFEGSEELRADLLTKRLLKQARSNAAIPWPTVVTPPEWADFPRAPLRDLVLSPRAELTPGTRALQAALEAAFAGPLSLTENDLERWWNARDADKLGRLLELAAHDPPLLAVETLGGLTAEVRLRDLAAVGAVATALRAELESGVLQRGAAELDELAALAADHEVLEVLVQSTLRGVLSSAWADVWVERADEASLEWLTLRLISDGPSFDDRWGDVMGRLLERLVAAGTPSRELGRALLEYGEGIDPLADVSLYLRVAELHARSELSDTPLVDRMFDALGHLGSAPSTYRAVVETALHAAWRCLQPRDLLRDRRLRFPELATAAGDLLAESHELLHRLELTALLDLGAGVAQRKATALGAVHDEITERMRHDPEQTTRELIERGGWLAWWEASDRTSEESHRFAQAWLGSKCWREPRGAEATVEAWEKAVEGLATLDRKTLGAIRVERDALLAAGPVIPAFEAEQLAQLAKRAGDLDTLLTLVTRGALRDTKALDDLRARSRFKLPEGSLLWLLNDFERAGRWPPPLDLESWRRLIEAAGGLYGRAVCAGLEQRNVDLHSEAWVAESLAAWLRQLDPDDADRRELRILEDHAERLVRPRTSSDDWRVADRLEDHQLRNLAEFLSPAGRSATGAAQLARELVSALRTGDTSAAVWDVLARPSGVTPPLVRMARVLRESDGFDVHELGERALGVLLDAASERPPLFDFRGAEGALPLFALGSALKPPGSRGIVAAAIANAADEELRDDAKWWSALIRGVAGPDRRNASPADREAEYATAVLLLVEPTLDDAERAAFREAVRRTARASVSWKTLAAEFALTEDAP